MAKSPQQSNTQLGISEQTAREFKRIAEQEEKAGTESWNDGEYDSAADHFERAANTLRKYAVHVQAPSQAQIIKRKASKLLDLCNQLRALTVDGHPDESKANRLRTESQSELAVINADIEAATPRDGDSNKRKAPDNSSALMEISVNVQKPPESEKPKAADLPTRVESAATPLVENNSPSQPLLRLLPTESSPEAAKLSAQAPTPDGETKTAPSLPRLKIPGVDAFEEDILRPHRVAQVASALRKCDFNQLAAAFEAIADELTATEAADPLRDIEQLLSGVFAREVAQVLRKAPEEQGHSALELARKAYAEGNFRSAAEQFRRAAMDLLSAASEGKSDEEMAANELRASKLLTFSSRLRKSPSP